LFTINRVFKHKEVVSNLHVCSYGLGKMWPSYTFHFSTRILNSTHMKGFNIFFAKYMTPRPTINFQLSIMSKWLAKQIRTKASFKITIRKRHAYIYIDDLEYEASVSIWEFEIMSLLNYSFAFISARYTFKFTKHKWNLVY